MPGKNDTSSDAPRGATIDRARAEAQAWAEWRRWADRRKAAGDYEAEFEGDWDPHDDERGAALDAWVRCRMAAEVERRRRLRLRAIGLANMLGVFITSNGGFELVQREARSRGEATWDGLADDDREALAHAVMLDLGLEGPDGEHGPAWTLCERAGWPDETTEEFMAREGLGPEDMHDDASGWPS